MKRVCGNNRQLKHLLQQHELASQISQYVGADSTRPAMNACVALLVNTTLQKGCRVTEVIPADFHPGGKLIVTYIESSFQRAVQFQGVERFESMQHLSVPTERPPFVDSWSRVIIPQVAADWMLY